MHLLYHPSQLPRAGDVHLGGCVLPGWRPSLSWIWSCMKPENWLRIDLSGLEANRKWIFGFRRKIKTAKKHDIIFCRNQNEKDQLCVCVCITDRQILRAVQFLSCQRCTAELDVLLDLSHCTRQHQYIVVVVAVVVVAVVVVVQT